MSNEIKEISLRELLDTEFTINDKMEMVGTFTLDRINMISDILTNLQEELESKNNIINECAEDILKQLEENHHLSYGVALGIRQKLLDYRELKEGKK